MDNVALGRIRNPYNRNILNSTNRSVRWVAQGVSVDPVTMRIFQRTYLVVLYISSGEGMIRDKSCVMCYDAGSTTGMKLAHAFSDAFELA